MSSLALSADPVPKWGRYVVDLSNPTYEGNPFELEIDATFTHTASGMQLSLPGYYAGNDVWKVGFMPTIVGDWTYETSSSDSDLDGVTGALSAVESGRRGLLKSAVGAPRKWKFADGPYAVPISLRFDVFQEDGSIERFTEVADFLANEVKGDAFEFTFRNEVYSDIQSHQFDLALWDRLEERLNVLGERGLGIHFMLYSDDSQEPLWSGQSGTERLFMRYLVARVAAYPIVIYNTGIDIAEYRGGAWIDWFGNEIRALDPYNHPISSRYGGGSGSFVMSDQTFDSRGDRQAFIDDMTEYFNISSVPVSMDDAWSENSPEAESRGKDFTEHDIRRAIWKCVAAGGLGALIRGSVKYNSDTWFRMADIEEDLESEQWLSLVNPFIEDELGAAFGSMNPTNVASNAYAISTPDLSKIFVFYIGENDRYDPASGDTLTLDLRSVTEDYSAYWFDTRTGQKTAAPAISGGQETTLAAPTSDDWVLVLSEAGGNASRPNPPTDLTVN